MRSTTANKPPLQTPHQNTYLIRAIYMRPDFVPDKQFDEQWRLNRHATLRFQRVSVFVRMPLSSGIAPGGTCTSETWYRGYITVSTGILARSPPLGDLILLIVHLLFVATRTCRIAEKRLCNSIKIPRIFPGQQLIQLNGYVRRLEKNFALDIHT